MSLSQEEISQRLEYLDHISLVGIQAVSYTHLTLPTM